MEKIALLFNQTPESLRRIGSRGGRATARNRRLRRLVEPVLQVSASTPLEARMETTAAAIVTLNSKFPWLRGAERRCSQPS
jgi:hypothetical protein